MIKSPILILFSFLLFVFNLNVFSQTQKPVPEKGVLDLRGYDFSENIELNGEWEFYWNELYDFYDFENKVHTPDAYINVPGGWSGIEVDGKIIPDTGYATLRLVIFTDPNDKKYTLYMGEVLTAYKVWCNNNVIAQIGKVGKNSNDAKPAISPIIKGIDFDQEKVQLIMQISNYNHRSNGIFQTPVIGEETKIIRKASLNLFFDIIIFGAVFIIALYYLGMFILRTKNKAALAFSLLGFVMAIRILFSSNYSFNFIFPETSWNLVYRISYFTFYALVVTFIFFFKETFEEKKYKAFFIVSYSISGLFALTLFLPTIIFTKLLFIYQISVVLMVLFSVYLLATYIKKKKTGAVSISVIMLIFFGTGINDMLYYNRVIHSITLTHVGIFVLILGQALTLAKIFTKSFHENEHLTAKLDYQNQNLQEIVDNRTKELKIKNQDVLQKNEELQVQKEELQVQKEEISRQKELLEAHNKLFTDSINYASTIQQAVLPSNETIKKYFNSFIIFLPKDIVSGDFYWFNDVNPKYLYFVVGDCTGHGVPGAFISLIAMYLLNSVTIEKQIENPKEILTELNKMFHEFLHKGQNSNRAGVDLGVLRFEKDNLHKVVYSAAKTNMFIYDSEDKTVIRHRGSRKSIGSITSRFADKNIKFENLEIDIKNTQTIYCSTDGFIDQNNPQRKRFGTSQFVEMIKENANFPIQQQKILIMKRLENHKQDQEQRDDITFIGLSPKEFNS